MTGRQDVLMDPTKQTHYLSEFTLSYKDLAISREQIEVALGYGKNNTPAPIATLADKVVIESAPYLAITGGYLIINDLSIGADKETLSFGGKEFICKSIISAQMQAATSVAVFVCTLGKSISVWSQELHTKGDSIKGYLVDILASVTIEKAVNSIHGQLEKKMADRKLGVTNRYSPGYCDWPVSDQHNLFSLLPEDFCGIRLTESAMMAPVKSVSGIIGIGPGVERVDYQCKHCQQSSRCDWGKI